MTYEILKKRRYVNKYDTDFIVPAGLIESLLKKTWEVTPSKNNFMPYTVNVIGPNCPQLKSKIYLNCLSNERDKDGRPTFYEERYSENLPAYSNILTCSYVLVFTMRLETNPNPFQKMLLARGHKYEAVDEHSLPGLINTTSFEAGLFCDALSALCIENGLAVSFTGCFPKNPKNWKDIGFVKREPIMIMTIGKAKEYLIHQEDLPNPRPNFERIVNFVEEDQKDTY